MNTSAIIIEVGLDEKKVPESIKWKASDTSADDGQDAKAMMVSFWNGQEKTAMRIDLWTKDMMVDEMADFFYQTMITLADTYGRATHYHDLVSEMKNFAQDFYQKSREIQMQDQKA